MSKLVVGDTIPQFVTVIEDGSPISDDALRGKKFILFFYGQDDTPTCTKEACSVRDIFGVISKAGYEVYGISKDNAKKHQKFKEKYSLPFSILVDEDTSIMKKFGYFGPKIFMGKEVQGIYRTTIVVDEKGTITHMIDDVKSAEHGAQILATLGL